MSEATILNAKGIFKGQIEKGAQCYHVVGEDANGNQVVLIFGCKPNFTTTVDTAFSRLFSVRFKAADPILPLDKEIIGITPEGDATNGTAKEN